jgi:hypothetical protein
MGADRAVSDRQRFGYPDRWQGQESSRPEEGAAEEFVGNESSSPGQNVNALRYRYPVTNPSTFQYPEAYHTRLLVSPDWNDNRTTSPASERRSEYGEQDWQPSTARLQPRIQPPPIR